MNNSQMTYRWAPVVVGIAGLITGYSLVIVHRQPDVFAPKLHCQMPQEICDGNDCDHSV